MDILLSINVFKKFLDSRSKFPKSDLERAINSLFENKNNRFILSKALVNHIEESVKGNPSAEAFLQTLLSHLVNSQGLNIGAHREAKEIHEVLSSMYDNYVNSNIPKSDLFIDISLNESENLRKKGSVVIENMNKPNHHWLLFNLACYNPLPVTLRYSDFDSNIEIKKTFKLLLTGIQNSNTVDIYDKQVNLDHNLFDGVKDTLLVHYFTCFERNVTGNKEKTEDLKSCFRRVKVFRAKSKHIHERKIIIKSLIIECDDDFWNLTIDRPNWKIDVTYSKEAANKLADKKKHFIRCRFC